MTSPMERIDKLLQEVDPSIAEKLRENFVEAYEMSFSNGYTAGDMGALERTGKLAEKFKNIGEARGITWAYHALKKNKIRDVIAENPYANPHLVNGILQDGMMRK